LLSNALKYSTDDRPVVVDLTVEGDLARVAVTDQGPGLTPQQQEQVWGRFQRLGDIPVQDHTHASAGGLGLGLYISRALVQRHGGALGVRSAPGVGSTFWFTLPIPIVV